MVALSTGLKWILDLFSMGAGMLEILQVSVMSSDLAVLLVVVAVFVLLASLLVVRFVVGGVGVEGTVG